MMAPQGTATQRHCCAQAVKLTLEAQSAVSLTRPALRKAVIPNRLGTEAQSTLVNRRSGTGVPVAVKDCAAPALRGPSLQACLGKATVATL
jgi:hypothetical protein